MKSLKFLMALVGWAIIIVFALATCTNAGDQKGSASGDASAPATNMDPVEEYVEILDAEIEFIESLDAKSFTNSLVSITGVVQMFNEAAKTYQKGATLALSEDQEAERQRLKDALSAKQKQAFPVLRDAYGPIMRTALWEANGSAKTVGAGFRTIEWVAPDFASNRNIAKFQEDVRPMLLRLRFTRSSYRWYEGSDGSVYTMTATPTDGAVVVWSENDIPVAVD